MKIELDIRANKACPEISLSVTCDNHSVTVIPADTQVSTVVYDLPDDPGDHVLRLVMSGKNFSHTVTDDHGQITDDVYFLIERLDFEGLDLQEVFCLGRECYTHSFNSNSPEFLDEFYGHMGCNGTVTLEFSTPIFLWLSQYFD